MTFQLDTTQVSDDYLKGDAYNQQNWPAFSGVEIAALPVDAYFKLRHIVDEVNAIIKTVVEDEEGLDYLSPATGNVIFASSEYKLCFSLLSIATHYKNYWGAADDLDVKAFARRLWGDVYFKAVHRNLVTFELDRSTPSEKLAK